MMVRTPGLRISAAMVLLLIALIAAAAAPASDRASGLEGRASVSGPSRQGNASGNSSTPPVFLDFNVTPEKGDTETLFEFQAWVVDPDGDGVASVNVMIDGARYGMEVKPEAGGAGSNRSRYHRTLELKKGKHSVYFEAKDGSGNLSDTSDREIIVTVSSADGGLSNTDRYICIGAILLLTVLVMVWTYWQFRKRKEAQKNAFESLEEDPEDASPRCSSCNRPVSPGDEACPHCSEQFEGVEEVCPFCKTEVPRGASKCPLCKKPFRSGRKGRTGSKKRACPDCGAVVDRAAKKCPGCEGDLTTLRTKKGKAAEKREDVFMCSQCGADVSEKDDKCRKCGIRFG